MAFFLRAMRADDLEHQRGLPPPRFHLGDRVRTVIGNVDGCVVNTEITARVASFGWHWKRATWLYKLAVKGHRAGRWYVEQQLQPVDEPSANN